MKKYDAIIIGGGAAGLMCAITAGQRGRRVIVLEHTKRAGKKILMSGGGRCNFTNLKISPENYLSHNPHFCKSALSRYTQHDFIKLVEKHGIPYHEKTLGQLFCNNSSKDILNLLLKECNEAGVEMRTQCSIESINFQTEFKLETSQGEFNAGKLVIATGGLSVPTMGATGFAYKIAQQFGLKVWSTRAALVPFTLSGKLNEISGGLSGLSVPVIVSNAREGFAENLLFTHRGLSGPAILQLSSYWREGEPISINLLPGRDVQDLLFSLKQSSPNTLLRNVLSQLLPKRLTAELEQLWWAEESDTPLQAWKNADLEQLAGKLKGWQLTPAGTEGYRTAEVTLGGVDTNELSSKTFESKKQTGLYFIGEAVDVTGHLGGYNFQWAWSSAYSAGQYV